MVSHKSLSDCKSPQVFWILLSILINRNNAIVWIVSSPLISKSSSSCTNPLMTVPRAPSCWCFCSYHHHHHQHQQQYYLSVLFVSDDIIVDTNTDFKPLF